MKKILLENKKIIVAFVLGIIISGTTVYATILYASNEVGYQNTSADMQATNVQEALDEFYMNRIDSDSIDLLTITTNSSKTILASSKGVCIFRYNKLKCFKNDNWVEEQNYIQHVFSDISCTVNSSQVECNASDFHCYVTSNGSARCRDNYGGSDCVVTSNGSVSCN